MGKHKPQSWKDMTGAWEVDKCRACEGSGKENPNDACRRCGGTGEEVYGVLPEEIRYIKKLIPELLVELKCCEERLATAVEKHFTSYVGDKELLAAVRAAIAKAEGKATT